MWSCSPLPPRQQDEILRKLRRGSIDLIVGTHRLVSKDVQFKDLGLVIIDEGAALRRAAERTAERRV